MQEIGADLKMLADKCGRKSIERARPYHDALAAARKVNKN
jgi:hypothetical protein